MKAILNKLFYDHMTLAKKPQSIKQLESIIEANKKRLKQNFNKKQKKLLLRIENGKDLKTELSSAESFTTGFKLGLKIGYEVNRES